MKREVYINKKLADVRADNQAGYMFTSPIFRDITKIVSNRTTTYKLPKTSNNLTIFGLSNHPEIISDFPYKSHLFEEHRDGLLFINGICTLLKSTDKDIEISVVWGATISLIGLKDLRLREIKIPNDTNYVDWGGPFFKFLESDSTDAYGFIKIDYGKGLTDPRHMRPAITIRGILDLIEKGTSISIVYPDRFIEVFKKTWIPLLSINANEITWEKGRYVINPNFTGYAIIITGTFGRCFSLQSANDPKGIINSKGVIRWNGQNFALHSTVKLTIDATSLESSDFDVKLSLFRVTPSNLDTTISYIETIQEQIAHRADDGYYHFDMETLSPDYSGENYFSYVFSRVDYRGESVDDRFFYINIIDQYIKLTIQTKEVEYEEALPIIPNLPDMSILDFLKAIMHMYGLFAYYDYRKYGSTTTVEFLSIDDIYTEYLTKAYDWTNKIIPNGRTRMEVSYRYGDYAQVNHFRYRKDNSVYINVDGSLVVNNTTLSDEKDLIELPFAPSVNSSDNNGIFASIKLFDENETPNQVEDRVLWRDKNYDDNTRIYITAIFDQNLHIKGDKGFLSKYYKAYQEIIKRPVVVEFNAYLSEAELYLYREAVPVFIDGIYYMIVEMTATNAPNRGFLCRCTAIKMPFIDIDEF